MPSKNYTQHTLSAFLVAVALLSGCVFDSETKSSSNSSSTLSSNGSSSSVASSSSDIVATSSSSSGLRSSSEGWTEMAIDYTQAFVFTSDYATGALRSVSKDSIGNPKSFNQDSKLVAAGDAIFVLERYGADNLVKLGRHGSIMSEFNDTVLYQQHLGDGVNPEDLVVIDATTGWLTLTGANYVLGFNPQTGEPKDSVDLGAYVPAGTTSPSASAIAFKGETLYIALQRLDSSWAPSRHGLLVLANVRTGAIIDTIQLSGSNPSDMVLNGDKLYVANTGSLMNISLDSSKSIDVVDLTTKQVQVLTTSTQLNGGPAYLALDTANNRLYVSIYKSFGGQPVGAVKLSTGEVTQASIAGIDNSFGGIAFDAYKHLLYVGDRSTTHPGVKIWNDTTLVTVPGSADVLPPYSIAVASWSTILTIAPRQ